jgi:hypothetical protein
LQLIIIISETSTIYFSKLSLRDIWSRHQYVCKCKKVSISNAMSIASLSTLSKSVSYGHSKSQINRLVNI